MCWNLYRWIKNVYSSRLRHIHSRKKLKYSIAINKFSSSITSELFVILHALYLVYSLKIVKVVIVTDSLSALQSITNWNWKKHSFSSKITLLCSTLSVLGYEIRFLWVPGYQNIPGNEMADKLAKLSTAETSLSPHQGVHYKHVPFRLNFSDILCFIPALFPRVRHSIPDRHTR